MDILQNVIYLILDLGHQVNGPHDWNFEGFLAAVSDDNKHKAVVWMKKLLIKERNITKNSKVSISLDVDNDL